MRNYLITVIVPVYNVEKYLDRCVESIVNQTYTNLEIILIDDGSPDNCPKMCDDWAKKDSRIKVIHKENGGVSSARNIGLDVARGEYVTFIDSDDYVAEDMLYKMLKSLLNSNTDMVICEARGVDDFENTVFEFVVSPLEQVLSGRQCLMGLLNTEDCYAIVCSKVYKTSVWDNIRFKKMPRCEDEEILVDVYENVKFSSIINEPLYYYFQHDKSKMHSDFGYDNLVILDICESRINHFESKNDLQLYNCALLQYAKFAKKLYIDSSGYIIYDNKIRKAVYKRYKKMMREKKIIKKTRRIQPCKGFINMVLFYLFPRIYSKVFILKFKGRNCVE